MLAQLLAGVLTLLLNAPTPDRLTDPIRPIVSSIPERRVLLAERAVGPELIQETLGPAASAEAFVVLDLDSGAVLAAREPSAIRPVASLTKVLTAFTALRATDPEEVVTVSTRAVREGRRGATMDLVPGEQIRVSDLLAGLLIPSANDAAIALAEHIAGSEAQFARRMEETARELGLLRTRAENATGFDANATFSSAYDVALLLSAAWKDPTLGELLRTEERIVVSVDGRRRHRLHTTNRLLGARPDVLGGKTGLTDAAGENLAVVAESPTGKPVVAVVLGSRNRFSDAENLLNWTYWAYRWPEAGGG